MGNENKKTASMTSSQNNAPGRNSGSMPSQGSTTTPSQLSLSHSFDQLPSFPIMSSPTSPALTVQPLTPSFSTNSFMQSPFTPMALPNSGFLSTPITNGLSLPFTYPPLKLPAPGPPMFRFNKYEPLFDDFDFSRYRARHYCCPRNYCPRDCHCSPPHYPPPPVQHNRPTVSHPRHHHTNNHSSHALHDKRHANRSLDHKHQTSNTQAPLRVVCRNS